MEGAINTLVSDYGLPGLIILGMGWGIMSLRSEIKELRSTHSLEIKEARDTVVSTLSSVLPLVTNLQRLVEKIEGQK